MCGECEDKHYKEVKPMKKSTKPMKNRSIDRIDPTVALINAAAGAIKLEPKRSVYETRGIRMI